jgi:hypothetical protein
MVLCSVGGQQERGGRKVRRERGQEVRSSGIEDGCAASLRERILASIWLLPGHGRYDQPFVNNGRV